MLFSFCLCLVIRFFQKLKNPLPGYGHNSFNKIKIKFIYCQSMYGLTFYVACIKCDIKSHIYYM